MVDAAQMRAARGLLGWTQRELAERSGTSLATVKNIERGVTDARCSTLTAIQAAFEEAGLLFVEMGDVRSGGRGVRFQR